MRVPWTLSAEQDRADIVDFIAQDIHDGEVAILALDTGHFKLDHHRVATVHDCSRDQAPARK